MWGAPEEPPDDKVVAGPSETAPEPPVSVKEMCEDNRSQLDTFKEIMLKNKKDLKKKEEELQEYASKLSEIKSRAKKSRRSRDAGSSSVETTPKNRDDVRLAGVDEDTVDDISLAKTPKAKSSLLQRKLAENRKIFEQRSKEMTESKRVVEEKVEAIRQQMDQTDLTIVESMKDSSAVGAVRPIVITPQSLAGADFQIGLFQDKDNRIVELNNRIMELEATVIDLQDNLREKDSVIDSKTRAVTLMSADLSKRGKSTLDTLEDTKDEMRTMQENFVLIETSLKGKNDNLLEQLQERNERVGELEATIKRYEEEMEEKRLTETAIASQSRTTMDTLADTKDAMRTMQENFVLIETSLKEKIDNLLQQLQTREEKLAEAEEKIQKYESGAGVTSSPEIPDLRYKIERLEQSNRTLHDEKYELQKSITELQEKIISRESMNGNGLIVEKDNRIAELENLIDELKNSNQLLEEESKAELQKQVEELATRNDEFRSKIDELERLNNDLEAEKNELRAKLPDDSGNTREDTKVKKLTKELEDLNKSMIKLKAQHKGKLRNLQKQLESFKMVSDVNAELVKLGNQVALLEEEKASAGDWQDRIADLESKVSAQSNDIQGHIEAIAILENHKLDLMQELHTMKQEISALEAENAESENLRVTAEMKIVDMEEQIESMHKLHNDNVRSELVDERSSEDLLKRIEALTQENSELAQRIAKFEEKPSSEAGSTESFETINEDRNELVKRMEALSTRNNELEEKLLKLEETTRSNVDSTESFETINDTDKNELLRKIDALSRENSDLHAKLNKFEEKGSSDTGSTESFEKIPEHVESSSRMDNLIRENNELVIKLTKLEEKLENITAESEKSEDTNVRVENLTRENNELVIELTKMQEKLSRISDEKEETLGKRVVDADDENTEIKNLTSRVQSLTAENHDLIIKLVKLEEKNVELRENLERLEDEEASCKKNLEDAKIDGSASIVSISSLEAEIDACKKLIAEQSDLVEDMRTKLLDKDAELHTKIKQIEKYESNKISVEQLQRELKESFGTIEEWRFKCDEMEKKMEILEVGKASIEDGLRKLHDEKQILSEETKLKDEMLNSLKLELEDTIAKFARTMDEERALAVAQEREILHLRESLAGKEQELHEKYSALQNEMIMIDSLQEKLNDSRDQLVANETIIIGLNEEIRRLRESSNLSDEKISTSASEISVLHQELESKAAKEARNEELVEQMKNVINEQLKENENLRSTLEHSNLEIGNLRKLLVEKDQELASLAEIKSTLEDKIRETTMAKNEVDERLRSLQTNFDDNTKYADDLKVELNDAYRMMELLKKKHTDDLEMQNRRLEDLIEDLNARTSECEMLRAELAEKTRFIGELETRTKELEIARETTYNETKRQAEDLQIKIAEFEVCREQLVEKELLVGQNVTEQVKNALEARVNELEAKLVESENNTQTQLQKRKILAANLKKKSAQCDELEAKAAELETKISEIQPRTSELESRLAEIEPRAAELELKVLELGATAEEFKARAAAFEAKIQELEPRAAMFEVSAAEFTAKALENEAKATKFQAKTDELEAKVADIEPRAVFFEAKTAELEAKLAELEPRAVFFETKSAELEGKILELEPRAVFFESKAAELEAEATALRSRATEFQTRAEEFAARVAELEPRAANYEAKAAESEGKVSELEVKAAEFEAKAEELAAKIAEIEPRATEMEKKAAELETSAALLEEKWMFEKSEKETSNKKIQDFENAICVKDETIERLEVQLNIARNENSLLAERAETLSAELQDSQQNIIVLTTRVTDMVEEIDKLRAELEDRSAELRTVRMEKESLIADHESQRQSLIVQETDRQQELDEAKEKARELGVRMQVMEAEYVEQLSTIQTQRTEIGMLASKHAQINERLENAEKESYERKILLDQIERERALADTANENVAETSNDDATRNDEKQSCDHCDQCQTVVQALEAKLQERDAEIENLDNELANSIGNFVHMRESLRVSDLMNQSASRSRSHEDTRDDLVFQYNALMASNAETREKLNATIHENQELREKIVSLQALNAALQERTGAAEEELTGGYGATRIREIEATQIRLTEDLQQRNAELEIARTELETARQRHEELMSGARSRITELENYGTELTRNLDEVTGLRNEAETQIAALKNEAESCQRRRLEIEAEFENYRRENAVHGGHQGAEPPAASSLFTNTEDVPQLFDAARVFGPPSSFIDNSRNREISELREMSANKEVENSRLAQEFKRLSDEIVSLECRLRETSERDARDLEMARDRCQNLETELSDLRELLTERTRQIEILNLELNNVGAQLAVQINGQGNNEAMQMTIGTLSTDNERLANELRNQERTIKNLIDENSTLTGRLANFELQVTKPVVSADLVNSIVTRIHEMFRDTRIDESSNEAISSTNVDNSSMLDLDSPSVLSRIDEIEDTMKTWKNARNELLAELEACKKTISSMTTELENSGTTVTSLEDRVESVVRERDIKQLQINDLTRTLEEMQERMENTSSSEETRLRNLQASLDLALTENDRLKSELETVARDHETHDHEIASTASREQPKMVETAESQEAATSNIRETRISESGWDEETKLDEDIWSWNPEDAQTVAGLTGADSLLPSLERRLNARIAELEDTIKDLEAERDKLNEEAKTSTARSGKLVKRLKEFKVQNENLRQQLKMQKATSELCDLDTAIEEELKGQIESLERAVTEAKDETRKACLERDNLSKRIDVLSSANERLVEMKERQDMEVEVLQIRLKELSGKLQSMEWQFSESCGDDDAKEIRGTSAIDETAVTKRVEVSQSQSEPNKIVECFCKKYKDEIDELRDEIEALAAENEQMQKLLEEQRTARLTSESELAELSKLRATEIDNLSRRNDDLQKEIDAMREDRRTIMETCENSEKTAEKQMADVVNRAELLKEEIVEKTKIFELEITHLRQEAISANSLIDELRENLRVALAEKEELLSNLKNHEETREKVVALSESMNELTDLLSARVQEVAELKREIQKLRADRNAAMDTVEDLAQNHSREISAKNEETRRYISECEGRINEQKIEIETLHERLTDVDGKLSNCHVNMNNMREEIERLNASLFESRSHRESLQSELANKEQELFRDEEEVRKYAREIERLNDMIGHLQKSSADTVDESNRRIREIEEREANLRRTMSELTSRESEALGQMYREISEKDNQVANLRETVVKLEEKIRSTSAECTREKHLDVTSVSGDTASIKDETIQAEINELKKTVEELRVELALKNEKIEDYKYQLSESTYPAIIQALQDQVNTMYEERSKIEESLENALAELAREREARENIGETTRYQSRQLKSVESDETEKLRSSFFNDDKDVEIRNLRTEIDERAERFRDLHDRYESVEMELNELRERLVAKENEILIMQRRLGDNGREGELLRSTLKGKLTSSEISDTSRAESSSEDAREISTNELDIALYMLHQRDVRCEELTHELMQLLEERDTLQLRLSNAIRINEELRKTLPNEAQTSDIIRGLGDIEPPLVEEPSPSRSVGPVEIAKEAIDSPNDEKIALAQKLSQLHNTGHRRDIRLMDDRDMRHNQQMSLLAHRDVLSTLPPEAAARIVNANYTLSRDVQSQSSILMNWLWGKSTPKVVHM